MDNSFFSTDAGLTTLTIPGKCTPVFQACDVYYFAAYRQTHNKFVSEAASVRGCPAFQNLTASDKRALKSSIFAESAMHVWSRLDVQDVFSKLGYLRPTTESVKLRSLPTFKFQEPTALDYESVDARHPVSERPASSPPVRYSCGGSFSLVLFFQPVGILCLLCSQNKEMAPKKLSALYETPAPTPDNGGAGGESTGEDHSQDPSTPTPDIGGVEGNPPRPVTPNGDTGVGGRQLPTPLGRVEEQQAIAALQLTAGSAYKIVWRVRETANKVCGPWLETLCRVTSMSHDDTGRAKFTCHFQWEGEACEGSLPLGWLKSRE
jgi:hypothetical protein